MEKSFNTEKSLSSQPKVDFTLGIGEVKLKYTLTIGKIAFKKESENAENVLSGITGTIQKKNCQSL